MEISLVRKRLVDSIDKAKRAAVERRERADEASRDYEQFLSSVAIPLFKQVSNALRAEGYAIEVSTPGQSVRLTLDRPAGDGIELILDTSGPVPQVIGHTSRTRGRRVIETEQPVRADTAVRDLTEDDVLDFLLRELQPFVER